MMHIFYYYYYYLCAQQIKEQQKKQLRKSKQLFRKLTMAAYQSANPNDVSIGNNAVWDDLEKMNDDVSKRATSNDTPFHFFFCSSHCSRKYIASTLLRRLNCCRKSCH